MNFSCRPIRLFLALCCAVWATGILCALPGPARSDESPLSLTKPLTSNDLETLRTQIFSRSEDYGKRVEIASTLTRLFEISNRARNARRLCLDFYDSIAPILEEAEPPHQLDPALVQYAQAIDRGKRQDTGQAISATIDSASLSSLPAGLSLIALKADRMSVAYQRLFGDFTRQKISAYSNYVLGILAAREKRFIEGERFMLRAQGKLASPILERWLAIDLAKLSIVNNKPEEAQRIIQDLLDKNPQDPQALNIMVFSNLETNKDLARQQLSQLIKNLYPDPYLIAETAKLAIQLLELDTAARILEENESSIEPSREFYEVFAFVRKNQGKQQEANQYLEKARSLHDSRVAVASAIPLSDELRQAVDTQGIEQKKLETLKGLDTLSKAYYYLLDHDSSTAIDILKNEKNTPYESFVLSTILRRTGRLKEAAEILQSIKSHFPLFRPYEILSLLADYHVRLRNNQQASIYSKELLSHFPDSYQAEIANRILSKPEAAFKKPLVPIRVSTLLSRYDNYAAPFILTEIYNHWGDSSSFASSTSILRVSPRQSILFHEFITVLASITRYQVIPFTGTSEAIYDCLLQDIPVVFCQGDMFDNQLLTGLTLLVGAAQSRGQFYTEGITPSDQHLYTESELLEGICFAVYPSSLAPQWSPAMNASIEHGKEFIKLHMEASHIQTDPDYDATRFIQRQQSILAEKDRSFLPLKLAFLRWTLNNKAGTLAKRYLEALEKSCQGSSHFWFLSAKYYSTQKETGNAGKALETAMKYRPDSHRFYLAKIRMLDQKQESAEAVNQAEIMRDLFPESPYVSHQLLLLYHKTGDRGKAEEEEKRLKKILNVDNVIIEPAEENASFAPNP